MSSRDVSTEDPSTGFLAADRPTRRPLRTATSILRRGLSLDIAFARHLRETTAAPSGQPVGAQNVERIDDTDARAYDRGILS